MKLGDTIPNFCAETSEGKIQFYDWVDNKWCILFSHPADFTPVCTTELAQLASLVPTVFTKRDIKVIALSCDSVESHVAWIKDIEHYGKFPSSQSFPYPIIADEKRKLAVELGMIDPLEVDSKGLPLTARAVFVMDPCHKVRLSLLYPATTGRNFDEIMRAVDSLLLTENYKVATPVDWKAGERCMVQPSVSAEEAASLFPRGVETIQVPSGRNYLRLTPQPNL